MKIGLVCATINEAESITYNLDEYTKETIYGFQFYMSERVIILVSGVGVLNISSGVILLIERYGVDFIISFGTCGAIIESLNSGDVLIPSKVFLGDKNNESLLDNRVQNFAFSSALQSGLKAYKGNLFTSLKFMSKQDKLNMVSKQEGLYKVDAVDMESAAIVQLCLKDSIQLPVMCIKIVSDTLDFTFNSLDDYVVLEKALLYSYKNKLCKMIDTVIDTMTEL